MNLKQQRRPVSRPDIPQTAETIRKAKEECEAAREAARAEGVPWHCAPPIADEQFRIQQLGRAWSCERKAAS